MVVQESHVGNLVAPFFNFKSTKFPRPWGPQNQGFGSPDARSDDLDALEALGNRILMPLDAL